MDFLQRLRLKPRHVRTRYALFISAAFTGVVALFWISSLPAQLSELAVSESEVDETAAGTGLTDLLDQTRDQFGNIIESANQIQELETESSNTPPSSLELLGRDEAVVEESESEPIQQTPQPAPQKPTPTPSGPRVIMIGTTTVSQ